MPWIVKNSIAREHVCNTPSLRWIQEGSLWRCRKCQQVWGVEVDEDYWAINPVRWVEVDTYPPEMKD